VQDALKALRGRTTMLVIAHRLSTIENADQIIVLDQGRILQQGSHAQLLAQNGLYAQLHRVGFASD
jgi:ATP-binding cassette, subfamily B, bacterial MsbA